MDGSHAHRRAFGRELRRWYESRGVSIRRLGDLIPCSFALVHRAAQGKDLPAPWMVVRADWCLGADGRLWEAFAECWLREELERPLGTEGSRGPARHHLDDRLLLAPEEAGLRVIELSARIAAAVASWPPDMKRRTFCRWTAFGAASLPAAVVAGGLEGMEHLLVGTVEPSRADALAIEQLRDTIVMCRQFDDLGMSAAVFQMGRRALARTDELLRDCTSAGARRPLTLIAGELCQLVGYAAVGLGDHDTARAYAQRAMAAADELGSAELHAYTMSLNVSDAELDLSADVEAATRATAAAQDWARLSGNPAVLSHAYNIAARAHARAGRERAALHALDEAERYQERSTPEERPTWLYWLEPAKLLADRGTCYLELHRSGSPGAPGLDETVAVLRRAVAAQGGRYPRDLARGHMNLADAHWTHGEREEAARHATNALLVAAGMEWRGVWQGLEDVRRRMEDDPLPAAREFIERFQTFVGC
jgi:tetratricopeptide (TPR) repeat protein